MKHVEYNFDNLGFPRSVSAFTNKMQREFRENNKMLFVKTKFQPHTGLELLKFNSSVISNTVIIVFKKLEYNRVELKEVEVFVKSDNKPSLVNFTKPRKSVVKKIFDLETQIDEFFDYIKTALWIDKNQKHDEIVFDCKLGIDRFEANPNYLTGARIAAYQVLDENTIELTLQGHNVQWQHPVNAKKATSFTMISDLVDMLLIISPDSDYKIAGRSLEKKLNLI